MKWKWNENGDGDRKPGRKGGVRRQGEWHVAGEQIVMNERWRENVNEATNTHRHCSLTHTHTHTHALTHSINYINFRPQVRERHEVDLYDMWEPLPVRCNKACVFFSACAYGRRVVTGSPNRNQTRYSQTSKTTSKHTDTHIKHRAYHFCIHKCSCKLKPQLRLWCNLYARERAANKREEKWVCVL